jgi:hypothetical protein
MDEPKRLMIHNSVADPGCLSRIRLFSIPDPGSASKNLSILTPKKWFLSSRKYDPGCSSRIRMLTFYPSRNPDPGVKKAPDPGSGSATLIHNGLNWLPLVTIFPSSAYLNFISLRILYVLNKKYKPAQNHMCRSATLSSTERKR